METQRQINLAQCLGTVLIVALIIVHAVAVDDLRQRISRLEHRLATLEGTANARISQIYDEMQFYTHPRIIQARTLDYLLKTGEFEGEK